MDVCNSCVELGAVRTGIPQDTLHAVTDRHTPHPHAARARARARGAAPSSPTTHEPAPSSLLCSCLLHRDDNVTVFSLFGRSAPPRPLSRAGARPGAPPPGALASRAPRPPPPAPDAMPRRMRGASAWRAARRPAPRRVRRGPGRGDVSRVEPPCIGRVASRARARALAYLLYSLVERIRFLRNYGYLYLGLDRWRPPGPPAPRGGHDMRYGSRPGSCGPPLRAARLRDRHTLARRATLLPTGERDSSQSVHGR